MADRPVRYDFLGRDVSASRTGEKVAKTYSTLGSKLKTAGKVIGTALAGVAVGGVALLGHAMVQGAKDAQSYQTLGLKTAAVIKSTGNQAHISVKGIQAQAAALESLSGVDEELIINGENVLATFTHIRNETGKGNDIFNQATRAALNMSTALGQDMQSSAVQLGKALNDPIKGITALSRVGVSFTQQQKDQIKTLVEHGKTLDAQKIILKELETEFGDAAKAAGGGLGGALARLQDAWGDMFRDIMGKALPGLTNLTNWIAQKGVPAFSRFLSFLQNDVGPGIGSALASLKGKLPDIDLSAVGTKIADQARQWGGDIIAGVKHAMDTGDWSGLGESVAHGIGGLGGRLAQGVKDLAGRVDWVNLGKDVGKTAIPFAVGFTATLVDGLITSAREHPLDTALFVVSLLGVGKIGGALAKVAEKIPFVRMVAPMLSGLNKITEPINSALGKILGPTGRAIWRGITEGFEEEFPRAAGIIKGAFETLIVGVYSKTDDAVKAGLRVAEGLGRGVGSGVGKILTASGRAARAVVAPFAGAGGWLVAAGAAAVAGLARGIGSRAGSALSAAGGVAGRVRGAFAGAGSWLYQAGRNIIGGLVNGIESKLGDLAGVVSRAAGTVTRFWPFSPAKEGPLRDKPPRRAGENIARMIAEGMAGNTHLVQGAARRLAGGAAVAGGPAGVRMAGVAAGGRAGSATERVELRIYLDSRDITPGVRTQVLKSDRRNGGAASTFGVR